MSRQTVPPVRESGRLLVRIAPSDVGMFRFLLEAHDNLAYFTVLERHGALLAFFFAPDSLPRAIDALEEIAQSLPLTWEPWPLPSLTGKRL